ncbi:hypothetical protein RJ640_020649 [Escallonia rubra]|uniref:SBP-type domain-containing protein n=1 Tax=Escallonia rubra TaxID=112253 RepID=A0AA88RKU3_9ASTE|nr:hypothetical protein RJ640_020649 [Escallonia rubra]
MEDVGAQVASPIYLHQTLGGGGGLFSMAKKRSLPFQSTNFQQQQQQRLTPGGGFQNPNRTNNWNHKTWDWDSVRFVAKPKPLESAAESERQRRRGDEENGAINHGILTNEKAVGDDEESLRLNLGGRGLISVEEPASRPNKRVRSGSPGGGNYPMCQVDNCKEDLSTAKDYHRRHKVCEVHSKATKALVGKQMQRFCQQCSRFHPLPEFDEGKRSCRRRLAGHNRRRRKTQPEDVTSRLLLPGNRENTGNGDNMAIVNLLTVLARAQGNTKDESTNCSSAQNKDQLMQILNKINSLPLPADLATKLPGSGNLSKTVPDQVLSVNEDRFTGNNASSTMNLLAVLSETLAGPTPEDDVAFPSQRSSHASDSEKTKSDQGTCLNLQKGPCTQFPSRGGERSSTSYQSPAEDSDCQVQEARSSLPLQLFSSSPEGDSPQRLASSRKYFSSDSSNPMEESSPSSSPPIAQKLFPTQSSREIVKPENVSTSGEVTANVKASRTQACNTSFDLFGGPNRRVDNGSYQSFPYQAGYTSSSGSDHSPASLNSDAQDRTGRIIFKLFDKDPSHLPGTLRTQIFNWLSHSPSDMESYIRPGCVVLSIYLSMSSSAWEKLEQNFFRYVSCLVQDCNTDFWRNGRFLVHTSRRLASHKDGKVHLCKSWRAWSSPELISVSPLAVVAGQATSLVLRGRNLKSPGTKIHCTHMGECLLKEVPQSACEKTLYDEIRLGSFIINDEAPSALGRCFIEIEDGIKGTTFPVIIADASICQELRLLESDFDLGAKVLSEDCPVDIRPPKSREEVLHFLNELGWLFQRKGISSMPEAPGYRINRFSFLFIFSVERGLCALVKTLLDILLERKLDRDEPSKESLEMLLEIHLLNRAVKSRCRNMVDLLVHYSIPSSDDASRSYIFPPNLVGPGGVTALHLAASTSSSDDIVDTLTSDPQQIGLHCWSSLLDANGLSPYACALMRNNHSYNSLVARKLVDKRNGQVSVSIRNEIEQQPLTLHRESRFSSQFRKENNSCSRCAVVAARYSRRIPGSQGLLHRPYMHSMLAIAAVCVCVCLFLRGAPDIGLVAPFKWENLDYGSI